MPQPLLQPIRTAVAAAATPMARLQICAALVETDIELLALERNALGAVEQISACRPDLLIADTELVQLDGMHLAAQVIFDRNLPVRPAVILLRSPELYLPRKAELEDMGVVVLDKPLDGAKLRGAVRQLERTPPFFPPEELARTEALLNALGIPRHVGRDCLKIAALLCTRNEALRHGLDRRLYPMVGEMMHIGAARAEQAMRYAIGLAWQNYPNFENQYRIFGDTIDAERGMPTCWEMISRLADILRLEG